MPEARITAPPARPQPRDSVPTTAPRPIVPGAAAAPLLGLNVGEVSGALPRLRESRTRHVRIPCYWRNMLDPRPHAHLGGRTVERHFLDEIALAVRSGLVPLVVVHAAPDDDRHGRGMPAFVSALAARMPAGIDIQLHNEANDPGRTWTPRLRGSDAEAWGADYARLFTETRAALERRGLRNRLVGAGLVGDPRPFLRGMRRAGARPEVVACHCYGQPLRVQAGTRAGQARDIYPDARVWYTEIGSERGMRSDDAQVEELADAVAAAHEARVDRFYWYRLDGPERGFELVRGTRQRAAWRRWMALQPR